MFNEPIETLDQAKEFFVFMNGSPYEMAREFPTRYDEYRSLNISKRTEREWREEILKSKLNIIKENKDISHIRTSYSDMYRLFVDLKTKPALDTMLETASYLQGKVPAGNDSIIIAETIMGQTARSARLGLIYMSYDMGHAPAAKDFIELAFHFSSYDGDDQFLINRSQEADKLCHDIKLELGL